MSPLIWDCGKLEKGQHINEIRDHMLGSAFNATEEQAKKLGEQFPP